MKKRFVARKRRKYIIFKIIVCILIGYVSCFLTVKLLFKNKINNQDEKKVNEYLAIASNNLIGNISILDLVNMNLSSPETFLKLSLSNFKRLEAPVIGTVIKPDKKKAITPSVYIYNTHQWEDYDPGTLEAYNITPTVYMASVMLEKALEKHGIYSIVEETNMKELLSINGWNYTNGYQASRLLLEEIKKSQENIKLYIDLHRDSTSSVVNIDGKPHAKLMFVVGLDNETYTLNEALMNQIHTNINNKYPDVMKNIHYNKKGKYNQDLNSSVVLIEVGGQQNKIDEVYNSINILAEGISEVLGGLNE